MLQGVGYCCSGCVAAYLYMCAPHTFAHVAIGLTVGTTKHGLHSRACTDCSNMCAVMQSGGGEVNGLTLGYNVARLHEANGESKQAQTFYSVCQPSSAPWVYLHAMLPLVHHCPSSVCASDCLCIRKCRCNCALPCLEVHLCTYACKSREPAWPV